MGSWRRQGWGEGRVQGTEGGGWLSQCFLVLSSAVTHPIGRNVRVSGHLAKSRRKQLCLLQQAKQSFIINVWERASSCSNVV